MTEEIKRAAKEICVCIPGNLHGIPAWEYQNKKCARCEKIYQALLGERRKAYEDSIEAVNNEPEFTDEMPDDMWETIKNDRALYSEVLRAVVVSTKVNVANEIRRRMEGV